MGDDTNRDEAIPHQLYDLLTKVIQESNDNIKQLGETTQMLAKGQEQLTSALLRSEERHASDLLRFEEKHEENRAKHVKHEADSLIQSNVMDEAKKEFRKELEGLKMKSVGYDKDFKVLETKSANQNKITTTVTAALILSIVIPLLAK